MWDGSNPSLLKKKKRNPSTTRTVGICEQYRTTIVSISERPPDGRDAKNSGHSRAHRGGTSNSRVKSHGGRAEAEWNACEATDSVERSIRIIVRHLFADLNADLPWSCPYLLSVRHQRQNAK